MWFRAPTLCLLAIATSLLSPLSEDANAWPFHRPKEKNCKLIVAFDDPERDHLSVKQRHLLDGLAASERLADPSLGPDFDGRALWESMEDDNSKQATFWAVTDGLDQTPIDDKGGTALDLVVGIRAIHGSEPTEASAEQFRLDVIWRGDAPAKLADPTGPAHFHDRPSPYHPGEYGLQQPSSGFTGLHTLFKPLVSGDTPNTPVVGDVHIDYRSTSVIGAILHVVHLGGLLAKLGLGSLDRSESHFSPLNSNVCAEGPERDLMHRLTDNSRKHKKLFKNSQISNLIQEPDVQEARISGTTDKRLPETLGSPARVVDSEAAPSGASGGGSLSGGADAYSDYENDDTYGHGPTVTKPISKSVSPDGMNPEDWQDI